MKKNKSLALLCYLYLSFAIVIFSACSKNDYQFENPKNKFNYEGNDKFISQIVSELKDVQIFGLKQSFVTLSPSWDKYRLARAIGDSVSYVFVPVYNDGVKTQSILKIKLTRKSKVIAAEVRSVSKNAGITDTENNQIKKEQKLLDIANANNEAFSQKKGLSAEKLAKLNKNNSLSTNLKRTNSANVMCSITVSGFYTYYPSDQADNAITYFYNTFRSGLQQTGFPFNIVPSGGGITVDGPVELTSQVSTIWYYAMSETENLYGDLVKFEELEFVSQCSNDSGGPPPGSNDEPCKGKTRLRAIFANPGISSTTGSMASTLTQSPYEHGVSVNYSNTLNGTITTTNVTTDNATDHVTLPLSWSDATGYTVGGIHTHPLDKGPDQFDIFALITQLVNTAGSGQQKIDFYKNNAFVAIIGPTNSFGVTVKDWGKLADLYTSRQQNPIQFDQHIATLTSEKNEIKAILEVFGTAINLFVNDTSTTDFYPITINGLNQIIEIPCP